MHGERDRANGGLEMPRLYSMFISLLSLYAVPPKDFNFSSSLRPSGRRKKGGAYLKLKQCSFQPLRFSPYRRILLHFQLVAFQRHPPGGVIRAAGFLSQLPQRHPRYPVSHVHSGPVSDPGMRCRSPGNERNAVSKLANSAFAAMANAARQASCQRLG